MSCPQCGGQPMFMGNLGEVAHFRCRECGWTWNRQDTPVTLVECHQCGDLFEPDSPGQRYCGERCQQARYADC